MKKIKILLFSLVILFIPLVVLYAADPDEKTQKLLKPKKVLRGTEMLKTIADDTGYDGQEALFAPPQDGKDHIDSIVENVVVSKVIAILKVIISLVGVIVLIFVIYGGVMWLTAGGNTDKVTTAKGILTNSIIGAIIVGMSYAIAAFVDSLTK